MCGGGHVVFHEGDVTPLPRKLANSQALLVHTTASNSFTRRHKVNFIARPTIPWCATPFTLQQISQYCKCLVCILVCIRTYIQ